MSKSFMDTYSGIRTALIESGVSIAELTDWYRRIIATYDEFAPALPDAMGWKRQKPAHARHCAAEAIAFAPVLGFNETEQAYFAIPFSAHDLGRMVEGVRKCLKPDAPEQLRIELESSFIDHWPIILLPERMHGLDSMELLKPILGTFAGTRIGLWTLQAVEHHSDVDNPTVEMVGGSIEALALCNILRDLDKVEGFQSAGDYTSNPERKARERLQNWPQRLSADPEWGTELGRIEPVGMLDLFTEGKAIPRHECRSYEAYMLQFLSWVYKIVEPEMLELALYQRGPQIVAAYLLDQLKADPEQHERLTVALTNWKNGVLIRA